MNTIYYTVLSQVVKKKKIQFIKRSLSDVYPLAVRNIFRAFDIRMPRCSTYAHRTMKSTT